MLVEEHPFSIEITDAKRRLASNSTTNNTNSNTNNGETIVPSDKNSRWKSNITREERVNIEEWITFKNTFKQQIREVILITPII